MIFITGDTHRDIDIAKLKSRRFPQGRELTKQDFVIICGDFGMVWDGSNTDKYWQKWLSRKPWTTLFVDGNHENFDMLNNLETVPMFGSHVGKVTDSIYHLRRGHVYKINNNTFFTMGGASSHDKTYREEGISWWPQEMISDTEINTALDTLEKYDYTVDYMITHCAPNRCLNPNIEPDKCTNFFEHIAQHTQFKKWFYGHYHKDKQNEQFYAMYDKIVRIDT